MRNHGIRIECCLLAAMLLSCIAAVGEGAFVFDLADAIGGGNGSLPGTGTTGSIGATAGTYTTFPSNAYIDGTFVPNNTAGAISITGGAHTYDFDAQTSAVYHNAWVNGHNLDTNPCSSFLPNFLGDSNSHSLMAAHANKGITFDLEAIRTATGATPNLFTVYAGDSRPKADGSISYWVFVDGVLAANRNAVTNSEDALFIALSSTAKYLTLAISDANDGIGSDHGYFGDPFLRSAATWTGGASDGNWGSGDNWAGGAAPTSSASTDIWITGDTNVGALSQNIATPFLLNRLQITGTGMSNAVNTGGQALSFQASGTLVPSIHISRDTAVTLSGGLNLAAQTEIIVDNGPETYDLTVSGSVTGSGDLAKYGLGTALFNGTNGSFTGNIVVHGGTLVVGGAANSHALGTAGSRTVTINSGATLTVDAGAHNPFGTGDGRPLIVINGGTMNTANYQHTSNMQLTGATVQPTSAGTQVDGLDMRGNPSTVTTLASATQSTISSKMTVQNAVIFDVAEGAAATDLLVSGQIVGAGSVTKQGEGLLVLSGANTYNGNTTIVSGTLRLGVANVIPDGSGKGTLVLNPGEGQTAVFDLGGYAETLNGIAATGAGTSLINNSGAAAATLTVGSNDVSSSFAGSLQNTGGNLTLAKIGAGTLTLTGTNTHAGGTTVTAGTLSVSADANLGSGAVNLTGGTLELAGATAFSTDNVVNVTAASVIHVSNAAGVELTGVDTLQGAGGLTKAGTGILTISSTGNTYTGRIALNAGTLRLGADGLINGANRIHNDWKGGGVFDLNGHNESVIALGGDFALTNSASTPATFTITDGGEWNYGGQISGDLAIVKNGSSWQQFSGASTYTGTTAINAGTLRLTGAGAIAGSSRITIAAGATLDVTGKTSAFSVAGGQVLAGSGTVLGTTVIGSGGVLAPGMSVGGLTMSGATWNPGGTFQFEINDATGTAGGPNGWDLLTITNAGGTGTLDLSGLSEANRFTIEIASLAGTTPGAAANFVASVPREWEFV
ncbi:MAG: autotransporter-associated beta strand repeat-containing protein, partial [Patescibacteria group bacterium]|nr:autotransporter-associated beta strand repeat-containing protein [Patescibacteria group bacterium]